MSKQDQTIPTHKALIKFKPTFLTVRKFFEAYNAPYKNSRDKRRLKGTTLNVAIASIEIFGAQLAKENKIILPAELVADEDNIKDYLPDLNANNPRIAKRCNISERTVRTHINKLIEAGFFVNKKNHGPLQDFELRFNPKVLRLTSFEAIEKIEKDIEEMLEQSSLEAYNQYIQERQRKNSPQLHNTRNLNNNHNNPVDDVEKGVNGINETHTGDLTGNRANAAKNLEQKQTSSSELNNSDQKTGNLKAAPDPKPAKLQKYIEKLALNFWLLAYRHIYQDFEFTEEQKKTYRNYFTGYFYKCESKQAADLAFEQYQYRIEQAGKYYRKNPNFNKLMPLKYFNPEYKNGFIATKGWWLEYRQKTVKRNRMKQAEAWAKEVNKTQSLELYNQCADKINSWGDQQVAQVFLSRINQTQNQ